MTKKQTIRFVVFCYGVVLACWLAGCLWTLGADAVARAAGTMQTRQLTFSDVRTSGLALAGARDAVSENEDPQIILDNLTGRMREVRIAFTTDRQPGEVNLYYSRNGEPFTDRQKIWGKAKDDGSYVFSLPGGSFSALRIDPASVAGVHMHLETLVLNPPRGFLQYFSATYEQAFHFIVWPGLMAAVLAYVDGLGKGLFARWWRAAAQWRACRTK